MIQSLVALAIALWLGFPGIIGDMSAANIPMLGYGQFAEESALVEIADDQVPLAGPVKAQAGRATLADSGNAAVDQTQTPATTRPATVTPTPAPTQKPDAQPTQPATTDNGNTGDSATDENEGVTGNVTDGTGSNSGTTDNGTTDNGTTDSGTTDNGTTDNGTTTDDAVTEEPAEEKPVVLSVAQRLLQKALTLVTEYNACTTANEKKALLEASNYSLGNDAFRKKLLGDMGGAWEQVEEEVVAATQYQQNQTLFAQVYMSGVSTNFQPVVYATKYDDLSGSQWSTNLVYDEETDSWMEYVKKHPYNNSRVGYGMTQLSKDGSLDTLQDDMQTNEYWAEVVLPDAQPEAVTTLEAVACTQPETEAAPAQAETAPAQAEVAPAQVEAAPAQAEAAPEAVPAA